MLLSLTFDPTNVTANAIIIAIVGYIIVFLALVVMYYIYRNIPRLIHIVIRQRLRREGKHQQAEEPELHVSGEVGAAISMALYLYFNEYHDEESNVVTIKKVSKRYSPWSSKIYGLNTYNR